MLRQLLSLMDTNKLAHSKKVTVAKRNTPAVGQKNSATSDQAGFVLHRYPYKETSLIVEVFTRHAGRIALLARGAKRAHSSLRGVLQTFQPLALTWLDKSAKTNQLHTLTRAEWLGGMVPLRGAALWYGFYLNELILKLLARHDPHESLFDAYVTALAAFSSQQPVAQTLRIFERILLREIGYALQLSHCTAIGGAIVPDAWYRYVPDQGPVLVGHQAPSDQPLYIGKTLLDIEQNDYSDATTLSQAKLLMRQVLQHQLAGQPLATRQMMVDLQNL